MYSFRELQKACKKNIDGKEMKLAVLGNCSTQFLSAAIKGYARENNLNLQVYDADYNQIDLLLMNSESEVYGFSPEAVLLFLGTEKLYEEYLDTEPSQRAAFASEYMKRIKNYWSIIGEKLGAKVLQTNFTEIDDKALGNFGCKVEQSFIFQIRKLNYLLQEEAAVCKSVYIVDALAVQLDLGRDTFFDAKLYYNAKMNVSMAALPFLAKAITDVLLSVTGKIKKAVVLDLDNTLWGGVIGEDGLAGIEIGQLGRGHVFTNFQRWLKQLKECGIILCVCSKNDEATAKEPFEKHEEMVLRLSDISVFVANWDDKASNLKLIRETLNIGMDSLVFIDDNPFERNLVKEKLPQIEVPDLPNDQSLWLGILQRKNYFEVSTYTGKSDRTALYQAEFARKNLEKSFESIDDYLKSLSMQGSAKRFDETNIPRIAELTQRSNQFNLRTVRYTEGEIKAIAESDSYIPICFFLEDKFGNHGLVSVVILKKRDAGIAFIDTWLMSCRVLKRGMEAFVINRTVDFARADGIGLLEAEYIPTAKNAMVKDIYSEMGFNKTSENRYSLNLAEYKTQDTFIKEKTDEQK